MIVAKTFHATVAQAEVARYTCRACAFSGDVIARGQGYGGSEAIYFIGQARARELAASRASKAAVKDALELVSLATCPNCNRRDRAAVRAAYLRRWTAFFWSPVFMMLFVAAIMIAAFNLAPPSDHPGDVVLGVFILSCVLGVASSGLLVYLRVRAQLRRTSTELAIAGKIDVSAP